ncbi:zinc ribbon domain-containing protein [Streptomyces sp. NPDC059104]|uniref:NADase-type glycan-binding domain-containing protein n=1 Tax=Streptomyces sp. NPDC059104 TaxID=3346729 RepID=UPI0036874B5D
MTTQNCAECGTRAEPGQSFCDACGAVLGWDQGARASRPAGPSPQPGGPAAGASRTPREDAAPTERAAHAAGGSREPAPAPAPAPEGQEGQSGQPSRPGGASGSGPAVPTRAPADGQPTGPAHAPPGTPSPRDTAPAEPVPATADPHALSDTMSERARSLLVPVADPEAPHPAPAGAGPVLPGRPDADRPAVRTPGQQPGTAGGPPCRWCSTPNPPGRHYCVRCAMPLAETGETSATARAPWWRRLFGGRRRETPWAGDRPRLRRVFDRIGVWITLAVVVTLAILGFVHLPDGVRATLDHFAQRAPVAPVRIAASRSYPDHEPELAFDKRSNTWWGPGVSQSGQGEWIEADFGEPTRLLDLIITPGVSARADKTGESAQPHHVTATITGKDGRVTTRRLTLDQGAGGQRRPFRVGAVTKVRFTVESSHAASADKQVAIAEIEFFGPSNADRS